MPKWFQQVRWTSSVVESTFIFTKDLSVFLKMAVNPEIDF
ncbi:hypothetical protein KP78_11920 [Jeotgalibacillus soli]|uniref:Uncharacterized protein n=1 Tax=Jeotgalibacillus soli TaxID=889306 RepID=A0A0C2S6R0_9BACL|nr:hypothetical protein KP78_11920 [Jeotgalibacillus soli]